MNKLILPLFVVAFCILANFANAEGLPANPWKAQPPSPNSGVFGDAQVSTDTTTAPVYSDSSIAPVDPWARARDKSNIRTWRGSGQHGKLNYIGEGTYLGSSDAGEPVAPEVNRHNMIVMLDHLRNMGYKIPESYNEKITDVPKKYRAAWVQNYNAVKNSADPISRSFKKMMGGFESITGLDISNLITNTVDILGTD